MTRKILLAAALAAAVAAATPALATGSTKPQIHDAKGDWVVASQDIVAGTITATAKTIQADLQLAAPPATGVRTEYDVLLYVGCHAYALRYTWNGGLPGTTAGVDEYACATGNSATDLLSGNVPIATLPATATATATGIRITAAPTTVLHSGVKVEAAAVTRATPLIVFLGLDSSSASAGGDVAYASKAFVLGT